MGEAYDSTRLALGQGALASSYPLQLDDSTQQARLFQPGAGDAPSSALLDQQYQRVQAPVSQHRQYSMSPQHQPVALSPFSSLPCQTEAPFPLRRSLPHTSPTHSLPPANLQSYFQQPTPYSPLPVIPSLPASSLIEGNNPVRCQQPLLYSPGPGTSPFPLPTAAAPPTPQALMGVLNLLQQNIGALQALVPLLSGAQSASLPLQSVAQSPLPQLPLPQSPLHQSPLPCPAVSESSLQQTYIPSFTPASAQAGVVSAISQLATATASLLPQLGAAVQSQPGVLLPQCGQQQPKQPALYASAQLQGQQQEQPPRLQAQQQEQPQQHQEQAQQHQEHVQQHHALQSHAPVLQVHSTLFEPLTLPAPPRRHGEQHLPQGLDACDQQQPEQYHAALQQEQHFQEQQQGAQHHHHQVHQQHQQPQQQVQFMQPYTQLGPQHAERQPLSSQAPLSQQSFPVSPQAVLVPAAQGQHLQQLQRQTSWKDHTATLDTSGTKGPGQETTAQGRLCRELPGSPGLVAQPRNHAQGELGNVSPGDADEHSDEPEEPEGNYDIIEMDPVEILAEHTHFCDICGKGFKRDANLRMHMRGHGDEYKTPSALARPDKQLQDQINATGNRRFKRFSCPYIGCKRNKQHKRFTPLKTMLCVKNHYRRTHCPKMLTCSKCGTKRFSVVADLRTHEKHCGKDRWLCSCGTTFSRKDKLLGHLVLFVGHMAAVPTGEDDAGVMNAVLPATYENANSTSGGGVCGSKAPRDCVSSTLNLNNPTQEETDCVEREVTIVRPIETPIEGSDLYFQRRSVYTNFLS